jgi:SAM-dependent methyltransferase
MRCGCATRAACASRSCTKDPKRRTISERQYRYSPIIVDSYDVVYGRLRKDDVDFYVERARQARGPVLELGCGTGRILVPSALAGAQITGLDLSDLMLVACRRKVEALPADVRSRVTLVEGSMTAFDLARRFALITIPFRAFSHLVTVEEQLACLDCVARHLEPHGALILDVFEPRLDVMFDKSGHEETEDCPESPLPGGRTVRRTNRRLSWQPAAQTFQVEFNYYIKDAAGDVQRLQESFPFRYYFRHELEHLLARAGLEIVARYGSYDRSPLTDEPREMIITARKANAVPAS